MENLSEGILLIVTGVVVVLVLLVLMSLLVRLMNLLDDLFTARAKRREEKNAPSQGEVNMDQVSPETVAAISMALNEHLKARPPAAGPEPSPQSSQSWASSGRLEIMSGNQKITSRLR
ncbi:MAG: OadG family transporter subunit [bacterium]